MYKTAFLGCGPRARAQARAYQFVQNGRPAAACDRNQENLKSFGREYGVSQLYSDAGAMLEKEKPDLLHLVTAPRHRVELMTLASEAGVPVVLVEKPIAVQGEDWRALTELNRLTRTKFLVNTQLHYHKRNLELKRDVEEGRIGPIRFVDVSARSTILNQGVHVLELAHSYSGPLRPIQVFAQVSGAKTLSSEEPSPDTAVASIQFEGGLRAQMVTGSYAPVSNPSETIYHHKRIAVFGAAGFVHWTMFGWERYTGNGGYERGDHDYKEEDDRAQGALTESALALLDQPGAEHPTRLDLSLLQFNIILGVYMSALTRQPVTLPCDPPDGLLDQLRTALG